MSEASTTLLTKLKAAKRLPSPPGVAIRVLELCRSESADVRQIVDVIMSDPALSSRLLKFANSPAMGARREVLSVRDAVLMLGLRAVKLTALSFSLATAEGESCCEGFDLKRFWVKSFLTAVIARRLSKDFFRIDREEAFTAGLLSGIGKMALAQGVPLDYGRALAEAADTGDLRAAEVKILGVDSCDFGGQLLAEWELPATLANAVAHQHEPEASSEAARKLASIIHVSRRLTPVFADADDRVGQDALDTARRMVEEQLKIDQERWSAIAADVLRDYQQVAEIFKMKLDAGASVIDLYSEAQEEASRVGMVAQLEQSRTAEENVQLRQRATTDALTGIANRAKFDERLVEATAMLKRAHHHFALIMFDIDHFKRFNDTYGHETGDLVLKHVAQTVRDSLREVDLLARYGGEEFVILAPETDRKGACLIAARVCAALRKLQVEKGGKTLSVTVSAGLALSSDYAQPPTFEQLLSDADKQLYLSKNAGRNTWSYLGRSANAVTQAAAAA